MLMTIPIMVGFSRLSSVRMRHTGCSLNNFWLCLLKPSGADASIIHFCDAFVECCTAATDTLSGISCHTHNREFRTGKSSGTAMAAMDNLAKHLPPGFAGEWAGSSLQEKESASQLPGLIVLSVLVVFMVLAALYESWSIPFAVMLVVPLGLLGAVLAVSVTNMTNDVFSKWV